MLILWFVILWEFGRGCNVVAPTIVFHIYLDFWVFRHLAPHKASFETDVVSVIYLFTKVLSPDICSVELSLSKDDPKHL